MRALCAALAALLAWTAVAPAHIHTRMAPTAHTIGHTR